MLAGGKGERLYPLTKDRAKPAVPFGGIYRIIDFTLSNCLNSNIRKIYILTQYKSLSLNRHLRIGWNIYNQELGEYIIAVAPQQRQVNRWYLGTADAIFQNIYTLQMERPKRVLILGGDHIYKMDYSKMVKAHIENEADVTIGAIPVQKSEAMRFGVIEVDKDSRVVAFHEKVPNPPSIPGDTDHCLASMGIYVFDTETLVRAVIDDSKEEGEHDFGKNILPKLVDSHRLFVYSFVDENKELEPYWRDIGTLDSYYEANMDLVSIKPHFNLYDRDWPVRTYSVPGPPAKFVHAVQNRKGMALQSLVSQGCIISGARVFHSIISPHVKIHSYASVENSILFSGVEVMEHARIKNTIIDKDVKIPQGYEIGYDLEKDKKEFAVTENGIVVVPKGMILEKT